MTNKGISLEEIKRLFEYLEQSKTDNKTQVIITNDMCKSLYDIYMTMYEYQKMVKNRISKAIEHLELYTNRLLNQDIQITPIETRYVLDILKGVDKE